jgi:hypothetical protein
MARVLAGMDFRCKHGIPISVSLANVFLPTRKMISFPPPFLTDLQHIGLYSLAVMGLLSVRE